MILTCNSCSKKFVVPDSAITSSGRMVQCGSCGNKWKQFPNKSTPQTKVSAPKQSIVRTPRKSTKIKKNRPRKSREINLYSPEYLAKKHGIKLNEVQPKNEVNQGKKVSFGFYNSLILFIFLVISLSRILYFSQDFIISNLPFTEFYLDYFFENIRNVFEIWKNLITY